MDKCRAHLCECPEYSHAGKSADYDVCACTHTRNIHKDPDGSS